MLARALPFLFLVSILAGCSTLSSVSTSDCTGCQNIKEIQDAYAANPLRAESEYVGQQVRIGGVAKSVGGKGIHAYIDLKNNSEIRLVAYGNVPLPQSPETHRIWEEWVAAQDVGDVVEAHCAIDGIFVPLGSNGPAMVRTKDCLGVKPNVVKE